MIRAVLDANVLLSYLIGSRERQTAVTVIVEAALSGDFELQLPDGLIIELVESVRSKRKLNRFVSVDEAVEFSLALVSVGVQLPAVLPPQRPMSRDPKDDYILLSALRFNADYLVTGDRDLLVLADSSLPLRIVTPAEFSKVLVSDD